MDQEQMMPAPGIRGRIAAVQVQGDEVIQVFGGNATAARLNTSYGKTGNYMYFRGGTLRSASSRWQTRICASSIPIRRTRSISQSTTTI
jgi:hypothetical protein